MLMAQGGEFAFVLYSAAAACPVSSKQTRTRVLTAAVILSMVLDADPDRRASPR